MANVRLGEQMGQQRTVKGKAPTINWSQPYMVMFKLQTALIPLKCVSELTADSGTAFLCTLACWVETPRYMDDCLSLPFLVFSDMYTVVSLSCA